MTSDMKENKSKTIYIKDDYEGIAIDLLSVPLHYRNDLESVFIPHGLILDRTEAIATEIFNDFENEQLICLCVLKGGFKFFSNLLNSIQTKNRTCGTKSLPMMIDFIRLKSYHNQESTGKVQVIGNNDFSNIKGKNVLIVEDIIDTGRSIVELLKILENYSPKKLKVCSLLVKRTSRSNGFLPDYAGFSVPDKYIVGDLNEHFRDLEHLCLVKPSAIQKYEANNN